MALCYAGTSVIQGADRVAPILFAASSAACAVGAVRVDNRTVWVLSGCAVAASFVWRVVQILAIEAGWSEQVPPDSSATAAAVYVYAAMSVGAVWQWLKPGGADVGTGKRAAGGLAEHG